MTKFRYAERMDSDIAATRVEDRGPLLLGKFDIDVNGSNTQRSIPAKFLFDYQAEEHLWVEVAATGSWPPAGSQFTVRAPGRLVPFKAFWASIIGRQSNGTLSFVGRIQPTEEPIESAPAADLSEITLALLDSPIFNHLVPEQRRAKLVIPCGGFKVQVTPPTSSHEALSRRLGTIPHRLTETVSITNPDGPFNSTQGRAAVDVLHDALSFAAGRWVGMTLTQGHNAAGEQTWFRWGTTRMSSAPRGASWFDPQHPEWLDPLCDSFIRLQANDETWDAVRTALYWYVRSNTLNAGVDSSLILSQCALELLSWLVIVRLKRALSEEGYGQLSNAAEKLRLTLTLLDIPRSMPAGLDELSKLSSKTTKDLPDAIVQARNYLVHPTQSRSGRRRETREWPYYQVWVAAQWLLELVLLSLLGYGGNYRNRTRVREFSPVERVPWA